jgi:hypothetical protein
MITSSTCSPKLFVREAQYHWKPCQISRLFEQNPRKTSDGLGEQRNHHRTLARAAATEADIAGASKIAAISAATVRELQAAAALLRPPQPGEASSLERWAQWAF